MGDQSWFWTKEWQAGERKVEEDLRNGDYETFDSMDEFLATLPAAEIIACEETD